MSTQKIIAAGFVAALALGAGTASAVSDKLPNGQSRYGQSVTESRGARVVDTTTAKKVNVVCGDTVTFVNGAKKFSWKFDSTSHGAVPLAKIAPAGFGSAVSTVYVSRNDSERGG